MSTTTIEEVVRTPQESFWQKKLEGIKVWFKNLPSWKTKRAFTDLTKAINKDADYHRGWQCNIAMPIFDGANGKLTIEESNKIADDIMSHFFKR